MSKCLGIVLILSGIVIMIVLVLLGFGAPNVYAQQHPNNETLLLSNIQNGTINQDMMNMLVKCTNEFMEYDDLYQGLKESEYGQTLNKSLNICDHNALHYYGLCEKVWGVNLEKAGSALDCSGADWYSKLREIALEPRPNSFFTGK